MFKAAVGCDYCEVLERLFIKNIHPSEKRKKYYSQRGSMVIIVVRVFNFMIIEVMSIFIVYELVNIILWLGSDILSSPKKD